MNATEFLKLRLEWTLKELDFCQLAKSENGHPCWNSAVSNMRYQVSKCIRLLGYDIS